MELHEPMENPLWEYFLWDQPKQLTSHLAEQSMTRYLVVLWAQEILAIFGSQYLRLEYLPRQRLVKSDDITHFRSQT